MKFRFLPHAICLTSSLLSLNAFANDCSINGGSGLFNMQICVHNTDSFSSEMNMNPTGDYKYTRNYNTIDQMIDQFDVDKIQQDLASAGYIFNRDISPVILAVDLRGLNVRAEFAENSNVLRFTVKNANGELVDDLSFGKMSTSRDSTIDELEDYLKKDGDKILNALAASSPVGTVVGNTLSLANQQIQNDFETATVNASDVGQTFGLGARFGQYRQGGHDITHLYLPLSYTFDLKKATNLL